MRRFGNFADFICARAIRRFRRKFAHKKPPSASQPETTTATYGAWTLQCERRGSTSPKARRFVRSRNWSFRKNQQSPIARIGIGHPMATAWRRSRWLRRPPSHRIWCGELADGGVAARYRPLSGHGHGQMGQLAGLALTAATPARRDFPRRRDRGSSRADDAVCRSVDCDPEK